MDRAGKKHNKKVDNFLPEEFDTFSIKVRGEQISCNMRELLMIANTESKAEIISAMNRASPNYFYFSRLKIDLEEALASAEESFALWFSREKGTFEKESSEKARERRVMSMFPETYKKYQKIIKRLRRYLGYSKIASDSFDKSISLLQSIGAMVRKDESNSGKKVEFPDDEGRRK